MQRNAIYAALARQLTLGLVTPDYGVEVVSRGFVPWDAADVQPAVYIAPVKEKAFYQRGTPVKWQVLAEIWVYVRWSDSAEQGVAALAHVMDGVDFVLSPTGPNGSRNANFAVNTLGGLVEYCALQGEGEVSAGFLNKQQCIARMPVEMSVPGG